MADLIRVLEQDLHLQRLDDCLVPVALGAKHRVCGAVYHERFVEAIVALVGGLLDLQELPHRLLEGERVPIDLGQLGPHERFLAGLHPVLDGVEQRGLIAEAGVEGAGAEEAANRLPGQVVSDGESAPVVGEQVDRDDAGARSHRLIQ